MDGHVDAGEHGVARVGQHGRAVVEELVQPLEQVAHGQRLVGHGEALRRRGRVGDFAEDAPVRFGGDERRQEVAQADAVIAMVADGQALAGGVDDPGRVELGGEDAQIDVGHEDAEQDEAVAAFDVLCHLPPAHRALIDAEVQRVVFAHHRLAEDGGGHGDVAALHQPHQFALQAEALDFDVGQDDRALGGVDARQHLGHGFAQGDGVWFRRRPRGLRLHSHRRIDHVAGQFDVDRPLVLHGGGQHAVDLPRGRLRVVQHGGRLGQLLEDLELGVEVAHLVVQQRIAQALVHARRAADDHHRRLLGVGLGGGVGDLQPADAVGDADHAQAVEPGVGIGREARALLVAGVDDL